MRSPEAYARSHALGAINLPHTTINATTLAAFAQDRLIVVYCWGPGCNGATKAALKTIGGIEYWQNHEHYPVVQGAQGTSQA